MPPVSPVQDELLDERPLRIVGPHGSLIIALDIPNQINNMKKEKLSKIVKSCGIPSSTESSIQNALKKISKENDKAIIFCTGSLYFAGEILNLN